MGNISKETILVVDDTLENIEVLDGILNSDYKVKVATNGKTALKIAFSQSPPDLILLDIMMPEMSGYEVCSRLKESITTRNIPVIFVTAKIEVIDESRGFDLGAVDYITKPVNPSIVQARVKTHLALFDQNRELGKKVRKQTSKLNQTRLEIINRLGRAAEYRDNETGLHVIRMSNYSKLLALAVGKINEEAELVLNAAPMHDIGKIGMPDNILLKPGKLTEDEFNTMKKHTVIGGKIIGEHSSELLETARIAALTHHEKWNGTGYPLGLRGEEIPFIGRVLAVADVFDALTSERPYKKAWPMEDALELIKKEIGKHFEPVLAEAFLGIVPEIKKIMERYSEK